MKRALLALAALGLAATSAHAEGSAESAFGDALTVYENCLADKATKFLDEPGVRDGAIADRVMARFCKSQRASYIRTSAAHFGFEKRNEAALVQSMDDSIFKTLVERIRDARKARTVLPRNNAQGLIQRWNQAYYRCLGERTNACFNERDHLSDQLSALGYCSERELVRHPHLPEPSRDWVWRPCSGAR